MTAIAPLSSFFLNNRVLFLRDIAPLSILYFTAYYFFDTTLLIPCSLLLVLVPVAMATCGFVLFVLGPMLAIPFSLAATNAMVDLIEWYITGAPLDICPSFSLLLLPLIFRIALTILRPFRLFRRYFFSANAYIKAPKQAAEYISKSSLTGSVHKHPPLRLGKGQISEKFKSIKRKMPNWVSDAGEAIMAPFNLLPEFSLPSFFLSLLG